MIFGDSRPFLTWEVKWSLGIPDCLTPLKSNACSGVRENEHFLWRIVQFRYCSSASELQTSGLGYDSSWMRYFRRREMKRRAWDTLRRLSVGARDRADKRWSASSRQYSTRIHTCLSCNLLKKTHWPVKTKLWSPRQERWRGHSSIRHAEWAVLVSIPSYHTFCLTSSDAMSIIIRDK